MRNKVYVKPEVRKAFETKFAETLVKAKAHHGKDIPLIPLHFLACGGKAGYFHQDRDGQFVAINPAYFNKPGGYEEQLNVTMPHEVAHYITRFLYGIGKDVKSHGWQWARVMRWIGLPPTRCHKMDVEGIVNRHDRPFKYQCGPNCTVEHLFTARKHIKVRQQGATYICKKCRNKLVFLGVSVKAKNRIETVPLAPRVIGIKFVPITVVTPVVSTAPPEPKPTHKTVTRFINGMLQNVQVPND